MMGILFGQFDDTNTQVDIKERVRKKQTFRLPILASKTLAII
jgi:hypothetical protein